MKQKHVGILYLLYFLLFLVDCYATRKMCIRDRDRAAADRRAG